MSLAVGAVEKVTRKGYIRYSHLGKTFALAVPKRRWLRVYLRVPYADVAPPPLFAYANTRNGHIILRIRGIEELREAEPLIRKSFELRG